MFRLESETYPGLTARDGSYSKKEFIDFQKQAATNFVEIIPEIDIPAHSLAFTHYKPEIGSKEYGMDHLDLFKPETYQFADNLFKPAFSFTMVSSFNSPFREGRDEKTCALPRSSIGSPFSSRHFR